jgi:hypothetical protein
MPIKLKKSEAYCVSCKKGVAVLDPQYVSMKTAKGRSYFMKGFDKLGHKLSKIISKDTYDTCK